MRRLSFALLAGIVAAYALLPWWLPFALRHAPLPGGVTLTALRIGWPGFTATHVEHVALHTAAFTLTASDVDVAHPPRQLFGDHPRLAGIAATTARIVLHGDSAAATATAPAPTAPSAVLAALPVEHIAVERLDVHAGDAHAGGRLLLQRSGDARARIEVVVDTRTAGRTGSDADAASNVAPPGDPAAATTSGRAPVAGAGDGSHGSAPGAAGAPPAAPPVAAPGGTAVPRELRLQIDVNGDHLAVLVAASSAAAGPQLRATLDGAGTGRPAFSIDARPEPWLLAWLGQVLALPPGGGPFGGRIELAASGSLPWPPDADVLARIEASGRVRAQVAVATAAGSTEADVTADVQVTGGAWHARLAAGSRALLQLPLPASAEFSAGHDLAVRWQQGELVVPAGLHLRASGDFGEFEVALADLALRAAAGAAPAAASTAPGTASRDTAAAAGGAGSTAASAPATAPAAPAGDGTQAASAPRVGTPASTMTLATTLHLLVGAGTRIVAAQTTRGGTPLRFAGTLDAATTLAVDGTVPRADAAAVQLTGDASVGDGVAAAATFTFGDVTVDADSARSRLHARGHVTVAGRRIPLAVSGELARDGDTATARLLASDADGVLQVPVDVVHDLPSGAGRGHAAGTLALPRGLLTSRLLPPPPFDVEGGRLDYAATITWSASSVGGDGHLTLAAVNAHAGEVTVTGIDAHVPWSLRGGQLHLEPVAFGIGAVDAGVTITNLSGRAGLDGGTLALRELGGHLLDGTFTVAAADIDTQAPRGALDVRVDGISLAALLALEGDDFAGSGLVDGVLPVQLDAAGIAITGGSLRARDGGSIRYLGDPAAFASTPGLDLAIGALRDFTYRQLEARVTYAPDGALQLGVLLEGSNPAIEDGRAIRFNLNLTENVHDLLASLRLADRVGEQVGNRVGNRAGGGRATGGAAGTQRSGGAARGGGPAGTAAGAATPRQ